MKTIVSLCFAVLAASAADAQVLRPEAVNGALRGRGVAGAAFGQHSRDHAISHHQQAPGHRSNAGYIYRHAPTAYRGHGNQPWHRTHGHRTYGHYSYPRSHGYYGSFGYWPGYAVSYYPAFDYGYAYPSYGYGSYGAQGLFWGGLAGAIIGHNSGTFRHDAWRGAAWGAATGWLLGTVADANRRAVPYETPVAAYPAAAAAVQPAASQPQQVTVINNYYNTPATPMSGANGLFGR